MRLLCLLLSLAAGLFAGSTEPPVRESVDLAVVTLNRLVLRPAPARVPGLLPAKKQQLPLSVQPYLKPSGQLDHLGRPVQKAAALIRHRVAPAAKQKDRLRDSPRVAEAVRTWLDEALPLDPDADWGRRESTDQRLAWPKASAIVAAGKADADGRALAAVAVLRALGVPARVAWARGRLTAQYWVALPPAPALKGPKPKKGAKKAAKRASAPKPPLGWWEPLEPGLADVEIDAWSLDSGNLARALWEPEQDLSAPWLGWERQVFADGDSLAARGAFEQALSLGHLSPSAAALQSLSSAAATALAGLSGSATVTFHVLTVQRLHLQSQGAMAGMDPIDLLTPYRPQLASWGRELPGAVRELELEAQGLASDRPRRLRLVNGKPRDEWKSPPPALGVQHYVSFGLRRFGSVLQAKLDGAQIGGRLLRADNLSARADWELSVTPQGSSATAQRLRTDAEGRFGLTLSAELLAAPCLELATPEESGLQWNGDAQRVGPCFNTQK